MPSLRFLVKLSHQRLFHLARNFAGAKFVGGSVGMQRFNDVKKPRCDDRPHRGLVMENGLKVVLVSDPSTDKSAAAMDVGVGNSSDPRDLPGLAHFLEHMLFMGTEKYPDEHEYSKYLSEHNGFSNAFTTDHNTQFYFDVGPDHFEGALDRFAQFFLQPSFTESATERELLAVNSENQKNLKNDGFRHHMIKKRWADPAHDFSKFGCGSLKSLKEDPEKNGVNVREALLKFHDQWYSANAMVLAVVAKEPLDELEKMVTNLFSGVVNKNVKIPHYATHPYPPGTGLQRAKIVPVKDLRYMTLIWPIPDYMESYRSNPTGYVSHLLGHEGKGCILTELKSRKWCNSLASYQGGLAPGFSFFYVTVDLTQEGIDHVDEIAEIVFQYLNLMRKNGVQKWVYEEIENMNNIKFDFKDKGQPCHYVSSLATNLHVYPIEDVAFGPFRFDDYKPDLVESLMNILVPENVRVEICSQKFEKEATETEPWFGGKYLFSQIDEKTGERWENCGTHPNLHFPEANPFIPTNLDLVERDEEPEASLKRPSIIDETPLTRVWYKQDDEFLLPKVVMTLGIWSPVAYVNPTNTNLNRLFTMLLSDLMTEELYPARMAGLSFNLCPNGETGVDLTVGGFNDKLGVLIEKSLEAISNFKVDENRFKVMKESYSRSLKNHRADQPYQHSMYFNRAVRSQRFWTNQELLDQLDSIGHEDVQDFIPRLFRNIFVESLIYGNVTPSQALGYASTFEKYFKTEFNAIPLAESEKVKLREVCLEPGTNLYQKVVNTVHKTSSVEAYFQCGVQSTRNNVTLELLVQLFEEPCFNILRTKEQLGYIVHCGYRLSKGTLGMAIICQSDRDPVYLDRRIEKFLMTMRDHIEEMPDEEFEKNRRSLIDKKLVKPKQLSGRMTRFYGEISSKRYNFDRSVVETEELKGITKKDVIDCFDRHVSPKSEVRKKLSCHVVPEDESEMKKSCDKEMEFKGQLIDRSDKNYLSLYPCLRPYQELKTFVRKC